MSDIERKERGLDAIRLMTKLLPVEDFGEDYQADALLNMIMELAGLEDKDLKDL